MVSFPKCQRGMDAAQSPKHTQESQQERDNEAAAALKIEQDYNLRDKGALFQPSVNLPPLHACPPENIFKGHRLVGDDILLHLKTKKKEKTQRNAVSFAVS